MSKHFFKMSVILIGLIIASIGNGCMGPLDGGSKDLNSRSGDEIKENSGVGGWSTYPPSSTGSSTGAATASSTGSATGSSTGSTTGSSGGGSGGGSSGGSTTGVTGGSGSCESGQSAEPASGSSTPPTCEWVTADWERLMDWKEQSQNTPYCGIFKICKNCCGSEARYDMFVGRCACPASMDASTLGANSNSMCEDEGLNYLAGFMEAKARAGISCTTVKDCMNCCGPDDDLDRFHVSCER